MCGKRTWHPARYIHARERHVRCKAGDVTPAIPVVDELSMSNQATVVHVANGITVRPRGAAEPLRIAESAATPTTRTNSQLAQDARAELGRDARLRDADIDVRASN